MAISKKEESTLKKHSKHHSKKHMNEMKTTMSKGKSFDKAQNGFLSPCEDGGPSSIDDFCGHAVLLSSHLYEYY